MSKCTEQCHRKNPTPLFSMRCLHWNCFQSYLALVNYWPVSVTKMYPLTVPSPGRPPTARLTWPASHVWPRRVIGPGHVEARGLACCHRLLGLSLYTGENGGIKSSYHCICQSKYWYILHKKGRDRRSFPRDGRAALRDITRALPAQGKPHPTWLFS